MKLNWIELSLFNSNSNSIQTQDQVEHTSKFNSKNIFLALNFSSFFRAFFRDVFKIQVQFKFTMQQVLPLGVLFLSGLHNDVSFLSSLISDLWHPFIYYPNRNISKCHLNFEQFSILFWLPRLKFKFWIISDQWCWDVSL